MIALLERNVSVREIAATTGYCARSVCYIARRYRESGLAAPHVPPQFAFEWPPVAAEPALPNRPVTF